MKKFSCCETNLSKQVQINISNIGNEPKTWRVFNGGTNLPSVDDNSSNSVKIYNTIDFSEYGYDVVSSLFVAPINKVFVYGAGTTGHENEIIVIDVETGNISTIDIGIGYGAPVYGGGNYVYVTHPGGSEVYPIDIYTLTKLPAIDTGNINSQTCLIYDNLLYVPAYDSEKIGVIDINNNTFLYNISSGSISQIAVGPNYIYGIAEYIGNLVIIDKITLDIVATLPTGITSTWFTIGYYDGNVYVTGLEYNQIYIINGETFEIEATIPNSGGLLVRSFIRGNNHIYFPVYNGILKINNTDYTYTIVGTGGYVFANYVPEHNKLYALRYSGLQVFDGDTNMLEYTFPSLTSPPIYTIFGDGITYNGSQVYVINGLDKSKLTTLSNDSFIPVTITVNGGQTTLEQLNEENRLYPFAMCSLTVEASDLSVFQNPITKILLSSAGVQESYQINLQSYITAFNTPGVSTITIPREDLKQNLLLDGNNFLQGVIKGNSSMSIIVKYCELKYYQFLEGNIPVKKKRYSHASFRFLKAD